MSLDERKMQILQAIIDDYITTASPVGSRTISKHAGLGLSSATIRNEMYDLKELGLLEQPHTSAGSMPSDKAYRLYVNSIIQSVELSEPEREQLMVHFSDRLSDLEEVIKRTAVVLSSATNYMSMVMTPQLNDISLNRIQLIYISSGKALLIIVSTNGLLKNTTIDIPDGVTPEYLDKISAMMTTRFAGCKLKDVSENLIYDLFIELGERREQLSFASSIASGMHSTYAGQNKVEVRGADKLLSLPEFSDIEKARELMSAIEHKETFMTLLNDAMSMELSVKIGGENADPKFKNSSVVTATYKLHGEPIGSLGVVGPTRMDYAKVLAVLKFLGDSMSSMIEEICDDDNGKKDD
ncbi:MAG: heat-inducible transcription repressor HrcA [Clostridia bacterium]|nr:heat-inducible transcription repressor HrcA [Clostridia bacterium]